MEIRGKPYESAKMLFSVYHSQRIIADTCVETSVKHLFGFLDSARIFTYFYQNSLNRFGLS